MISENIFLDILLREYSERDGSLEVPHAKATQYNDNPFGKELISLPQNGQLNTTLINLVCTCGRPFFHAGHYLSV